MLLLIFELINTMKKDDKKIESKTGTTTSTAKTSTTATTKPTDVKKPTTGGTTTSSGVSSTAKGSTGMPSLKSTTNVKPGATGNSTTKPSEDPLKTLKGKDVKEDPKKKLTGGTGGALGTLKTGITKTIGNDITPGQTPKSSFIEHSNSTEAYNYNTSSDVTDRQETNSDFASNKDQIVMSKHFV
jgi:hypothetical protein